MKRILYLFSFSLLSIFLLSSCATSKMIKQQEQNKKIIKSWYEEGWNQNRNKELIPIYFSEDWEEGNPILSDQMMGQEGMFQLVDSYRNAFADLNFHVEMIFAEGDKVCVRYVAMGTHTGSFFGIPPSGKSISTSGVAVYEMENGKVKVTWTEADLMSLLTQLK